MRYVISDIHGCSATFEALLDKIQLSQNDTLFLLGDYIDKTLNGHLVLDRKMELQEKKYQIVPILGNHEKYVLDANSNYNENEIKDYLSVICKSEGLLNSKGIIQSKYLNFIEQLPYYVLLDDFFLVHAGLDFSSVKPIGASHFMLENRQELPILEKLHQSNHSIGNRAMIFGHQVYPLQTILHQIKQKSKIIPLDNGCYYKTAYHYQPEIVENFSHLCCFNLDNRELTYIENIEKQELKKRKYRGDFFSSNQIPTENTDNKAVEIQYETKEGKQTIYQFKEEKVNIFEPKIDDWIVGGFYYYVESFPTMKLLVRIASKSYKPDWGIELNLEIIYNLKQKKEIKEGENLIKVSYQTGRYGHTYMWTLDYLSQAYLKNIPEYKDIILKYLNS